MVNIEINLCFLNRNTQVGFNPFKGYAVLAIILEVEAVKIDPVFSQSGNVPPV